MGVVTTTGIILAVSRKIATIKLDDGSTISALCHPDHDPPVGFHCFVQEFPDGTRLVTDFWTAAWHDNQDTEAVTPSQPCPLRAARYNCRMAIDTSQLTPEQIADAKRIAASLAAKARWAKLTPEQRSKAASKLSKRRDKTNRSEGGKKAMAARLANKDIDAAELAAKGGRAGKGKQKPRKTAKTRRKR